MSNYTKATNFAQKDGLSSGDPNKIIKGSEIDAEYNAIAAAIQSKANLDGPTFTGTPNTPTASAGTSSTQVASTAFVQAALIGAYPVGSIYFNAAVATNPNTLLGFGTWAAYGGGRVMVGVHSSGTFDGLNETGGAETHTLSTSEIPSHSHDVTWPRSNNSGGGGPTSPCTSAGDGGALTQVSQTQGGGGAHNNLQPYITVYMWKRTA